MKPSLNSSLNRPAQTPQICQAQRANQPGTRLLAGRLALHRSEAIEADFRRAMAFTSRSGKPTTFASKAYQMTSNAYRVSSSSASQFKEWMLFTAVMLRSAEEIGIRIRGVALPSQNRIKELLA